MTIKSAGFIGGGRITKILLEGIKRAGQSFTNISVSDSNPSVLYSLKESFPEIEVFPSDNTAPASCDLVILAVHPPVVGSVLSEIGSSLTPQSILLSLAPKFTISRLSQGLGGCSRIARMIPNAASIIGEGYNPIAFGSAIAEEDKKELLSFLAPIGQVPIVSDEKLEAYAVITAMGPTYFWFQWVEMKKLALGFGLNEEEADDGIRNMLQGAVRTMFDSGLSETALFDLIPVKPIGEDEEAIKAAYQTRLTSLYEKLKS
jgi:pyrroline-5-carboxylate reductase